MKRSGFTILHDESGKAGLADKDGKIVAAFEYDKILDYDDDGYIRVLKGDIYGTLDLEGRMVIPHSAGLTHLGVFHKGTARAQKDGHWGLVDEKGKEVTDFRYKEIDAHRSWGYGAIRDDNREGVLSEDGVFTPYAKPLSTKPRYRNVRTFHNNVAPALNRENKWVFVDRDLNRVNKYEYREMDPVLRDGVYSVSWDLGSYGIASYDGTPITTERFDYPLHFEDGVALTQKIHMDENGKEECMRDGQPRYDMGVLKANGEYLFPPIYHTLHWNDYTTKDCWYAEDMKAAYLLYIDGTRRAYDKKWVERSPYHPFIPDRNKKNYISEAEISARYEPKVVYTHPVYRFNEWMMMPAFEEWRGRGHHSSLILYRDTDAPIDVEKYYQPGRILRCGYDLEATPLLKRPAHKFRFLIATPRPLDMKQLKEYNRGRYVDLPFERYVLHRDSYFWVYGYMKIAGVTQIMLLQVPRGFVRIARQEKIDFRRWTAYQEGMGLRKFARADLRNKMLYPIHGYSLSAKWVEKMRRPIGIDDNSQTVPLEPSSSDPDDGISPESRTIFDRYYESFIEDPDYVWKKSLFMKDTGRSIQVVIGDITRMGVDAIAVITDESLLGEREPHDAILRAAGKELLEKIRSLGGCPIGESRVADAHGLPCGKIIHTVVPVWHGDREEKARSLASYYENVLSCAKINDLSIVAFPHMDSSASSFPQEEAARIAVETVRKRIENGDYDGDIIFCCSNEEDARIYEKWLKP